MSDSRMSAHTSPTASIERILAGDPRAVARAISLVEDNAAGASELMHAVFPHTGRGLVVGITGSPGAGKSSLVDRLAGLYRGREERVGIVAVDPSSPFSGGAILGDRIRMQTLGLDPGVFIRSMATRGQLGGLARATIDAVAVLDAAGYDKIIVETVGVGQDEVEIVKTADVTIVVLVPGMGDDVQALKAGIMEIADVFVINKADRDGVLRTEKELEALLSLAHRPDGWQSPVIKTIATENKGLDELSAAIESYRDFQRQNDNSSTRRASVARWRITELLREQLLARVTRREGFDARLDRLATEVAAKRLDPYRAVEELLTVTGDKQDICFTCHLSPVTCHAMKIEHIGIATERIEEALKFWRDALGLEVVGTEEVEDQGVRVAMLPVGETRVELLEPTREDSPVAKFLAKRGAGVHHIAVRVPDIREALARLKQAGARLIDEEPRRGADNCLIAFVHPQSSGGVLLELVEHDSIEHAAHSVEKKEHTP